MMRMISAKRLVERLQRDLGYTSGVPTGTEFGVRLGDGLTRAIERVWTAGHWPMLRRLERRVFRMPYSVLVGTWEKGQECFYGGEYWRAQKRGQLGKPGEDEGWELLKREDVVKFVALDQAWENTAISVGGVELNAFAYAQDPKFFPEQAALEPCYFAGDYPGGGTTRVMLPKHAPNAVWCAFIPDAPRVDFGEVWAEGGVWNQGDVVFYGQDCWLAVMDEASEEPHVGSYVWEVQRVPEFMADAVLLFAKSGFLAEDAGRARSEAQAQERLDEMLESYFGGQAEWEKATFSVRL